MVEHRSISLPECGPTEYPAPEPCFNMHQSLMNLHTHSNILNLPKLN